MPARPILLTGATGTIGSRLVPALLDAGHGVRALTRDAARIEERPGLEVVEGDLTDAGSLEAALAGTRAAYYLVHSLGAADFADTDRRAAENFARAAAAAGLERIVYLGGLGRGELSPHLASRQEVGRILRESGVPTAELRASIVIGDGSVSFDALRALVDLLPLVVLPDWARNPSQPVAVDDVIAYLVEALEVDLDGSAVLEIGGADRVPYVAILEEYARQAGKIRAITTVPAPGAVADLAKALQPLQPERARVVADLLDSLQVDTSVHERDERLTHRPLGLVEAIAAAVA